MPVINYLGVDVGSKRIGMAIADSQVRIACPLATINYTASAAEQIAQEATDRHCAVVVVGYPRNQSGEPTQQTAFVEAFAQRLRAAYDGQVVFQDESLTSVIAEERLGKTKKNFAKGDVDAEAACIIVTDYMEQQRG